MLIRLEHGGSGEGGAGGGGNGGGGNSGAGDGGWRPLSTGVVCPRESSVPRGGGGGGDRACPVVSFAVCVVGALTVGALAAYAVATPQMMTVAARSAHAARRATGEADELESARVCIPRSASTSASVISTVASANWTCCPGFLEVVEAGCGSDRFAVETACERRAPTFLALSQQALVDRVGRSCESDTGSGAVLRGLPQPLLRERGGSSSSSDDDRRCAPPRAALEGICAMLATHTAHDGQCRYFSRWELQQ